MINQTILEILASIGILALFFAFVLIIAWFLSWKQNVDLELESGDAFLKERINIKFEDQDERLKKLEAKK